MGLKDVSDKIESEPYKYGGNSLGRGKKIGVAVVVLLILVGVYYFFFSGSNKVNKVAMETKSPNTTQSQKCEDAQNPDICFNNKAITDENSGLCASIEDMGIRDGCYKEVARRTKNVNICQYIVNSESRDKCVDALKEAAPDVQDQEELGNLTECFELTGEAINNCLTQKSMERRDFEGCDLITNEIKMQKCYYNVTKVTSGIAACGRTKTDLEYANCVTLVAKLTMDAGACANIAMAELRDNCYSDMGKTTNQITACESIENIFKHDECLVVISRNTHSYVPCQSIIQESMKQSCFAYRPR